MKKEACFSALIICAANFLFAQDEIPDSTKVYKLKEVVITANRQPIELKNNPGSISVITGKELSIMPKKTAADEALRLVPGVRIDNQHDGERVHVSIRGQGILTERGLRSIGVIIDGIPVNDPSGFAPDLYDVDWSAVNNIQVIRGPVAGLYGTGGAAGVIYITTNDGGKKSAQGEFRQSAGSNGFLKSFMQIDGSKGAANYRISYSRTRGNGYRDHQAFRSNKLYEKLNFYPSDRLSLTQIISHTDYFQQNPEGLNLGQFDNLRQANPDARPFNEYQKTNRTTIGLHGTYLIDTIQGIEFTSYLRAWNYKETSNRCAEYRTITNPGASVQYNLHLHSARVKHELSAGADYKQQSINMYKLQSAGSPERIESIDETNIETDSLLANQIITQQSTGLFLLYRLNIGKFNLMGNVRYDYLLNELKDKMAISESGKTDKNFSELSGRIGTSYNFTDSFTLFANWSQGYMPPSTEELASNPAGYSGFNTHLIPATSNCYETGVRGSIGRKLSYDISGFYMKTKNDFFRFKQTGRGNQEVFYGNAGNSTRYGIESFISVKIIKNLSWQTAYTYSDFKYTSSEIDPVYTDTSYVLTAPPAPGQWLPNSPKHHIYSEITWSLSKYLKLNFGTEYQSEWAIYTDAKAYNGELDPEVYKNWTDGFTLYNAGISYKFNINGTRGEFSIFGRNLAGAKYMAFTEPDPDG
ncbi:TonB-dependent receptor, partial [bacterium]|nr:TonB-dependent receptor [bacterium]